MVKIKPFAALRPPKKIAHEIASRPYDVLNSQEAKAEAGEKSLLHIIKPEIDFDPIIDEHSPQAYAKAVENFHLWQKRGWLQQDPKETYYIYAQTMNHHTQYGLVAAAAVDDYLEGRIKKHELTRKDKEDDRMIHLRIQNANIEPVFLTYPDAPEINELIKNITKNHPPEYDFTTKDNISHHLWTINNPHTNTRITQIFAHIPALYVADGHHRTAAAARIGLEKRQTNPHHTGHEKYNYFMAVIFPESHLQIIDYNRLIKDLNGLTPAQLLDQLNTPFDITQQGPQPYTPTRPHNLSMYLDGQWYSLKAKPATYNDNDPIATLDVTILSTHVLDHILHLGDLRTSKRIDFVGGIRGLHELQRRVDNGEMAVAFALHPVTMKQLIDIADNGHIMPPKTTWFEPKLRSGLTIHKLS
ncbi:MAG: DUF1015 family protein [Prevotellaceae bacterium]|jgi:uncharacterized protein (DUF1015 family)|nr:DUF1015 family protein [Prevotellaceae bacterium]